MKPYVKIFSVVFCLLILLGALPFTASAYDGESETIEAILEIENIATDDEATYDEATYDEATYDEATYDEATYDEICYATIDELYCATYCSGGVSIPKGINSSGRANDSGFAVVTNTDKLPVDSATKKVNAKSNKGADTPIYDENMPKIGKNNTKQLKVQSTPVCGNMLLWIISGSALSVLGIGTVCVVLIKRRRQ